MVIKRTLVHIGTIVAAVAMLVPVGSAATATAATPVPVNSVDHTVLVQTAQADEYGTESFSDCTNILENLGYEITPVRLSACLAAAILGTPQAVAACTATLVGTGVLTFVAGAACVAAIA